jgi:hypothetical protein
MSASKFEKPTSFLSKRRLGIAGLAAVIGCVACCALPWFVAAGSGGSAAAAADTFSVPDQKLCSEGSFSPRPSHHGAPKSTEAAVDSGPSCSVDVSR